MRMGRLKMMSTKKARAPLTNAELKNKIDLGRIY